MTNKNQPNETPLFIEAGRYVEFQVYLGGNLLFGI